MWLQSSQMTLFCHGIPGAGKTILTSVIVDELTKRFSNDTSTGIAYIYCNFREQRKQHVDNLLASLLKQLTGSQSSLLESLEKVHNHHKRNRTRPSPEDMRNLLKSAASVYSRVFIIVDALDECQESQGFRANFLLELFNFQSQTGANLFATSRPIQEIAEKFKGGMSLEIRALDEDVQTYLTGQMYRLPLVESKPDLQATIKTTIAAAVRGMCVTSRRLFSTCYRSRVLTLSPRFLLAPLHIEALTREPTIGHVESALQSLPRELDETYKQALTRVQNQGGNVSVLAEKILCWVVHARRVLSIVELQHALAIQLGKSELDEKFIPSPEVIGSVCAGLVTIDKDSDTVRLVHYTAQAYFERSWAEFFPDAHTNLAKLCLTYVSFSVFDSGFCKTDKDFRRRLQTNRFYDYAARNWGYHAYGASSDVNGLILQFLESDGKRSSSTQVIMPDEDDYCFHNCLSEPTEMTGLHVAAYFGLRTSIIALLESGYRDEADVKDSHGRTPLWLAAKEGHDKVACLLLENGASPNPIDDDERTPLWLAAKKGHEAVVKLLLGNGADADPRPTGFFDKGVTPLHLGAEKGSDTIVRLLLKSGADQNVKDYQGRTPLWLAIEREHYAVAELLLAELLPKNGANSDPGLTAYFKNGVSPLQLAVEEGSDTIVRLLLRSGADQNVKDYHGRRLLWLAMEKEHYTLVDLLLENGADPNSRGSKGRSLLWHAIEKKHYEVAKLLLENGADLEPGEYEGRPLPWQAMEKEHYDMVKLLLENVADPDFKNYQGRRPLWLAAERGYDTVVKLLLENGADPDYKNYQGRTPLWLAAENGHDAVVKLLLDHGADIKTQDM